MPISCCLIPAHPLICIKIFKPHVFVSLHPSTYSHVVASHTSKSSADFVYFIFDTQFILTRFNTFSTILQCFFLICFSILMGNIYIFFCFVDSVVSNSMYYTVIYWFTGIFAKWGLVPNTIKFRYHQTKKRNKNNEKMLPMMIAKDLLGVSLFYSIFFSISTFYFGFFSHFCAWLSSITQFNISFSQMN